MRKGINANYLWRAIRFSSLLLLAHVAIPSSAQIETSHFGASAATWAGSEGWSIIQNLNVHYMRIPIEIQKGAIVDNFFLTTYDNYVSTGQANDIIMYGIINPQKNGSNQWPTANEFYNAVKTTIEHYDGDGTNDMTGLTNPVKNWEVCNEVTPNSGMYQGFTISDYLMFVDTARAAINETCNDCKLFNGAQVGPPVSGSAQSFSTSTLDDLITGEGTGIIDGISYHDYLQYFEINNAINDFSALGIQNKPIWLTEAGMQEEYIANNSLTQDDNARQFICSSVYAFLKGVDKIIYASVRAQTIDPDYVKWQSLLDPSTGNRRKVYYAYKKMIEKLDYFTNVNSVPPFNDSTIFAVEFTGGSLPVYVLWSTQSQTVTLNMNSPYIVGTLITNAIPDDTLGNFTTYHIPASGGYVNLNLSTTPVYVEADSILTGLPETQNEISFSIYPNPVTDKILISGNAQLYDVTVYNSGGKKIIERQSTKEIDVSLLSKGLYFLKILDAEEGGLYRGTFIKE